MAGIPYTFAKSRLAETHPKNDIGRPRQEWQLTGPTTPP